MASDLDWIEENGKEINKKYKGNFIAVKNKKIIAFSEDPTNLFKELERIGVKKEETRIEWIPPKNEIMIF